MSRYRTFLNAAAFQLGWFACVAGGNAWALSVGPMLLAAHYFFVSRERTEWMLIGAGAAMGLALDMAWQQLGLLKFEGAVLAGIPPWLCMLWLLFMTTVRHALAWLQQRAVLAAVIGAVAGPASYLAGVELGAAETPYTAWQIALALGTAWMLLLPLLMNLHRLRAFKRGVA